MPIPSNDTPSVIKIKTECVMETQIAGCKEYIMYVSM